MALYKRGKRWHMDAVVNGARYREALGTTDWREAQKLERERVGQLKGRAPNPAKRTKSYGAMDIETATGAYIAERRAQVSTRMVVYWEGQARPSALFFKTLPLKRLTPAHLSDYQNARVSQGRAAEDNQRRSVSPSPTP